MKFSFAVTLLIAAVTLFFGWRQGQQIDVVRETNNQLASRLGLVPGGPASASKGRETRRQRAARPDVSSLAVGLIGYFSKPESGRVAPTGDLSERLSSLNRDEFRELFEILSKDPELDEDVRRKAFRYAFNLCVSSRPRDAIELLIEFPDVLAEGGPAKQNIINTGLVFWSREAPDAALAWFRKNQNKSPDFSSETAKSSLISGIAFNDPRLAFQLFSEFNMPKEQLRWILSNVRNEGMADAVAALRGYAEGRAEPAAEKQALEVGLTGLAARFPSQDFDRAVELIAAAKLTPAEQEIFADQLEVRAVKAADGGQWIGWLQENLSPEKADLKIRTLVSQWTFNDYQAASDWIDAAPPGSARDSAVRSYVDAVAPFQPENAARQAMTLPAGAMRQDALIEIFKKWPDGDEAAKAAFGRAHGLD